MKAGLFAINYATCADPDAAVRVARAAEAAGLESVWAAEHIVLPDPKAGRSPIAPETPLLDIGVALTLVAAHTTTLRIGSGIIVLPQRNPLVLAKELASLDVVSGGRLLVGVGAGYLEQEFAALGVPFARRGARTDDHIRALRAIWSGHRARHDGEFTSFADVTACPLPLQRPHPPIVIGGENPLSYRRAVTMGNGWYGFALTLAATRDCLEGLRRAADDYARPAELGDLEISVTPVGEFGKRSVEEFAALGVHRLIMLPRLNPGRGLLHAPLPIDAILHNVDLIGETVTV